MGSAVVVVTEFSSFVWLFPSQNMQIYIVKAVEWKTKVKKNIEVQQLCTSSTSPLIDIIIAFFLIENQIKGKASTAVKASTALI